MKLTQTRFSRICGSLFIALLVCFVGHRSSRPSVSSTIVQSSSAAEAEALVKSVGGSVTHELGIIDAVGAELTSSQLSAVKDKGARVYGDAKVEVAGTPYPNSSFPTLVGAATLHQQGITGKGVTVAVLDTGWWSGSNAEKQDTSKHDRAIRAEYNAITNKVGGLGDDKYGHGTHILSLIMGSQQADDGTWLGIAPDANLVEVMAFDSTGAGTYANVIRGLNWILANKATYNIRILNCSFAAPAKSRYWDDPINQA
ncbi:MAG: S8 family serine peptidase, partial [Thermoanaerobaculia bacterium]